MNSLDIAIIAIFLISIFIGLLRGITREIFSLLSIFCGIIIASRSYQKFSSLIFKYINNEPLANIISFVVAFLITSLLVSLIGIILEKMWKILHLTLFDRIFGAIFGIIRGFVLIGLMVILVEKFSIGAIQRLMASSMFFPFFSLLKDILISLFPFQFLEK
ncbi:MAG: CvpA family protein [bacterium]